MRVRASALASLAFAVGTSIASVPSPARGDQEQAPDDDVPTLEMHTTPKARATDDPDLAYLYRRENAPPLVLAVTTRRRDEVVRIVAGTKPARQVLNSALFAAVAGSRTSRSISRS